MIFSLVKNFICSYVFRGIASVAVACTMLVVDDNASFYHALEAGLVLNGISLIAASRGKKKRRECTQIDSILKNGLKIK